MSPLPMAITRAWRHAVRERYAQHLILALPPALVIASWCWRGFGFAVGAAVLAACLLLAFGVSVWRLRRRDSRWDRRWLLRQLERQFPQLEDSAALALGDSAAGNDVERLQAARIRMRLQDLPAPALRPRWPRAAIAASATLSLALALTHLWPDLDGTRSTADAEGAVGAAGASAPVAPTEVEIESVIEPPAYTGLRRQTLDRLDVQVPEGSLVRWRIRLQPQPRSATLRFSDGQTLALQRDGGDWTAARTLAVSTLVDLTADDAAQALSNARIDVTADRAPQITVRTPAKTLSEYEPQHNTWAFDLTAQDDYGIADATLTVTHAHGTGENIEFTDVTQNLPGTGDATERRYRSTMDLSAFNYEEGDDLIARVEVRDNREPEANVGRSPAMVLRWPVPPFGETEVELDGVVRDTLPAYFRSQRQIIIDTEALLDERSALTPDAFEQRSDRIGVDQRLLRLRYGQFLGEETEPGGVGQQAAAESEDGEDQQEHEDHSGHDHDSEPHSTETAGFGAADDVLSEFGHVHDQREAATLFDPNTRATLKAALDEMWQSEGLLRTGQPDAALPYEYKALAYIKQVQQAGRIYLSRVGMELPELDEARRLSGELDNLATPTQAPPPADAGREVVRDSWTALSQGRTPPLSPLSTWAEAHADEVTDPLSLRAALNRLQAQPDCAPCRDALRAQLWPLLPLPGAGVLPRAPSEPGQPAEPIP